MERGLRKGSGLAWGKCFRFCRELDQVVYVWTNLFSPLFSFKAFKTISLGAQAILVLIYEFRKCFSFENIFYINALFLVLRQTGNIRAGVAKRPRK